MILGGNSPRDVLCEHFRVCGYNMKNEGVKLSLSGGKYRGVMYHIVDVLKAVLLCLQFRAESNFICELWLYVLLARKVTSDNVDYTIKWNALYDITR